MTNLPTLYNLDGEVYIPVFVKNAYGEFNDYKVSISTLMQSAQLTLNQIIQNYIALHPINSNSETISSQDINRLINQALLDYYNKTGVNQLYQEIINNTYNKIEIDNLIKSKIDEGLKNYVLKEHLNNILDNLNSYLDK